MIPFGVAQANQMFTVNVFGRHIKLIKHKNLASVEAGGAEMAEDKENPAADTKETKTAKADENTIYVGNKPVMNYVLAVVTQVNSGQKEVNIEARGRAISRAVDVAEIVRKRFMEDLKIGSIEIDTEELTSKENEKINVSTIKIPLQK